MQLLENAIRAYDSQFRGEQSSSYDVYKTNSWVSSILNAGIEGQNNWLDSEIHDSLLPVILQMIGVKGNGAAKPHKIVSNQRLFEILPVLNLPLEALRTRGEASQLNTILKDSSQPSLTRIACGLILFKAGEDLPFDELMSIQGLEKDNFARSAALVSLAYGSETEKVGSLFAKLLDGDNREFRELAAMALHRKIYLPILPTYKKRYAGASPKMKTYISQGLANYPRGKSTKILFQFLKQEQPKSNVRNQCLAIARALATNTGIQGPESAPGRKSKEKVKEIVDWWLDRETQLTSEHKPNQSPLFQQCDSRNDVPSLLVEGYEQLVASFAAGKSKTIETLVLPQSVKVSATPRVADQLNKGDEINLPFLANGFDPKVLSCKALSLETIAIRTSTTEMVFANTMSGWRLYRYRDEPIEK